MAELVKLEAKLGEVTGLAMAAQAATRKVISLSRAEHEEMVPQLKQMRQEAAEAEERCTELAGGFDGKKTAILAEAQATKNKASEMMSIYLDEDADALDGFEFLTMAEAAEVGHWSVLRTLNASAGHAGLRELVEWALPIQEGHFNGVARASLQLAAADDPTEPA